MKKDEFLKKLRKKLDILEETEINDIISEYEGYIDEKINKGATEEDAIKSMGDINELASELLSAYKIKKPLNKEKDSLNDIVSSIVNIFNQIIDVFANKSFNEIIKFIIELIVIFLIIALFRIPFEIVEDMGRSAIYNLGIGVSIIGRIWKFILELIYLIFAVILFIKIFESRYLKDVNITQPNKIKKEKNLKETRKQDKLTIDEVKKTEKEVDSKDKKGLIDLLVDICLIFVKFIVFWILLGDAFYIFGMAVVLGIIIYLIIKGVFYFGIYFAIIALFNLGIIAFIFLYNFIFNRHNKTGVLLGTLLINLAILGVGMGVGTIEIANTSFSYEKEGMNLVTKEKLIDMKENLIIYDYSDYNEIKIDNNLGDKIKIEYVYSKDIADIEIDSFIVNRGKYKVLYSDYSIKSFFYNGQYVDMIIEGLKNKNIKSYGLISEINIYASEENAQKLEQNKEIYDSYYYY